MALGSPEDCDKTPILYGVCPKGYCLCHGELGLLGHLLQMKAESHRNEERSESNYGIREHVSMDGLRKIWVHAVHAVRAFKAHVYTIQLHGAFGFCLLIRSLN